MSLGALDAEGEGVRIPGIEGGGAGVRTPGSREGLGVRIPGRREEGLGFGFPRSREEGLGAPTPPKSQSKVSPSLPPSMEGPSTALWCSTRWTALLSPTYSATLPPAALMSSSPGSMALSELFFPPSLGWVGGSCGEPCVNGWCLASHWVAERTGRGLCFCP